MFELMITKMSLIQESITDVKASQNKLKEQVCTISATLKTQAQTNKDMQADLDDIATANIRLVEATIKCESEINTIKDGIYKLAKRAHKGEFLLYGLQITEDNIPKVEVESFLKKVMKIEDDILVTSAHAIGKKANSPVWFCVEDPDDVVTIFSHVSNLKQKKEL